MPVVLAAQELPRFGDSTVAPARNGNNLLVTRPTRLRSLPARFRLTPDAKQQLQALWGSSVAAGAERVACLGGHYLADTVVVGRVRALGTAGADSTSISAQESIDTCGPPEWLGTVHTHIPLPDGEQPFKTFSGADRGVMLMWWKRWKSDGIFCVLWSDRDAYCERDGVAGEVLAPRMSYGRDEP
ncbi:MAG: hypothetical protein NW201_01950 [Gemmatimonadales bacterium]|nr:hypothetical protein [Gemmatimonadales bacterium]